MKKYIPVILIFVLSFYSISSAEYTREYKSGNTVVPDYRSISCFGVSRVVNKPQVQLLIKNG